MMLLGLSGESRLYFMALESKQTAEKAEKRVFGLKTGIGTFDL